MARRYDAGWAPYVPVAERRKNAEREIAKLRKKGHSVAPVTIEGRTIARTFWGKAWCENLESYRDYENRLPRGRTYVRNGSVLDLQISALKIKAMVSGSSTYKVTVTIKALPPTLWRSICKDCAGGIDSLVELLQGRLSKGVMERICRQDRGLFPKPSQIRFSCTCPDGAYMCKHVAAVLYGVGARLDEKPELLFELRAVDENDLVANLDEVLPFSNRPVDGGKVLETEDVSALFGLDMEEAGGATAMEEVQPAATQLANATGRKRLGGKLSKGKKVGPPRKDAADLQKKTSISQPVAGETRSVTKQASRSLIIGKAGKPPGRTSPNENHKLGAKSKSAKRGRKQKPAKREYELTPDGFVIWWK